MTTSQTFNLGGRRWQVEPLGARAQIEVEIIFLHMFGPGLAGAASAAVEELAEPLVDVLRKQAERPEIVAELASLAGDDLSPDSARAWGEIKAELLTATLGAVDGLVQAAAAAVRSGVPAITDRLQHEQIIRLFELAIFASRCYVAPDPDQPGGDVTTWAALDRLLDEPQAKYRLLIKALGVTYAREGEDA